MPSLMGRAGSLIAVRCRPVRDRIEQVRIARGKKRIEKCADLVTATAAYDDPDACGAADDDADDEVASIACAGAAGSRAGHQFSERTGPAKMCNHIKFTKRNRNSQKR